MESSFSDIAIENCEHKHTIGMKNKSGRPLVVDGEYLFKCADCGATVKYPVDPPAYSRTQTNVTCSRCRKTIPRKGCRHVDKTVYCQECADIILSEKEAVE